jgi:hypothetical protein
MFEEEIKNRLANQSTGHRETMAFTIEGVTNDQP